MMKTRKTTTDALVILNKQFFNTTQRQLALQEAELHLEVSMLVYNMRTNAGLTQKELADLIGTKQSVISRLEDADYTGHSLQLINRIAFALGKTIVVSVVDPAPAEAGRTNGKSG